jgi:hypothetical protein
VSSKLNKHACGLVKPAALHALHCCCLLLIPPPTLLLLLLLLQATANATSPAVPGTNLTSCPTAVVNPAAAAPAAAAGDHKRNNNRTARHQPVLLPSCSK